MAAGKRIIDMTVSLVLILLMLPLFGIIAALIKSALGAGFFQAAKNW
jgi:lipopolysaccharide/colanic/teichoic acid biosynthesis glycosyltransferase